MNPYATPQDNSNVKPVPTESLLPSWPLTAFSVLAVGAWTTAASWVWFVLQRTYNTASPIAESLSLIACLTFGFISLGITIYLQSKSLLLRGSLGRVATQLVLVAFATAPCVLALLRLVDLAA